MSRKRSIFRANISRLTLNENGELRSGEASSLENIIYYKGNLGVEQMPSNSLQLVKSERAFSRLFKAYFNGKERIFAGGSGVLYDIESDKEYTLDGKSNIESVISIGKVLYCACGDKLYMVDSFEMVRLINSFFMGLDFTELSLLDSTFSSIAFFQGTLYFADKKGVGYFDTNLNDRTYLLTSIKQARLLASSSVLFIIENNNIFKLEGAGISKLGSVKNASLYTCAYSSSLVGIEYSKSGFSSFLLFSSKTGSEIVIKSLLGFNIFLEKLANEGSEAKVLSSNNKLYLAFSYKEGGQYYGSLYGITLTASSVVLGDKVSEEVKLGDSPIADLITFSSNNLILSFSEERLRAFDFNAAEVHYFGAVSGSHASATAFEEGFFFANSNALFKATKNEDESNITCLAFQNGRLIVAIRSMLYYSAIGNFAGWDISKAEANEALFLEIGYKDESEIVEVATLSQDLLCFLKNGKLYRVSGAYPSWQVSFLGRTPEITSKPFHFGSTLIFATTSGIKALSPSDAYGDYIISNYRTNSLVDDSDITHIFLSDKLSTLFFLSKKRVLAESLLIGALSTFKRGEFIACAEAGGQTYFISNQGMLYKLADFSSGEVEIGLNNKQASKCLLKKIRIKLKEDSANFSEINLKISFKTENGYDEVPILKEVTHIKKLLPELSFKLSANSHARLDFLELELG